MARYRLILTGCEERLIVETGGSFTDVVQDLSVQRILQARLVAVDGQACRNNLAISISKIVAVVEVDTSE
ncbi:hypothetical protein Rumeso_03141 [Rubellimicrobium mesophilum DSM 19309]|uniref:Uncharacterized protein n=1 Tax=Rubellimicrobium mesophilum DSM 19309 TaxID=442562 RepID=A0A017HLQ0_9RHOB|nr:hypothetical protein [Rubellimicrobium mesophilum]EYD75291.1 hypothetical protein Rumeso_03141 [Rubellimicrobium mesophilum DSM 19309]